MMNEFKINDFINKKVSTMQPSGIRKFFDVANNMEGAISLGVGEPDFATPWHIRDAGIYSLEKAQTHYTSNSGLLELREEICNYYKKFDVNYDVSNVLITVGGSEGVDLVMRTVLDPGDEVLVHEPSFVCYKPCALLAGGVPVTINTTSENGFKLTAKQIEEKITPKTKMLVLSYPNNPTGAIMSKEDLMEIADVVKKHNILVLSDEIYAEMTYSGKHCSIASLPDMKDRCVVVNGFSKAYAMTGWRLGYTLANEELTKQMTKVHQYGIMSSPTTSQYAAIEAIRNGDASVKAMIDEYNDRRKLIVESFNNMGLTCFNPEGAFYIFPSIQSTGLSSNDFCEQLLMKEKVAVVPGVAFGESGEGFIRVSYAYSIKQINEAIKRIDKFLKELK